MILLLLALTVDTSGYDLRSGIRLKQASETLTVEWPSGAGERAAVTFRLTPGQALLARLAVNGKTLARDLQPVYVVTSGSRVERPNERYIFFDKPASRPTETHQATLDLRSVTATSAGRRVAIRFATLTAGPFSGELVANVYAGSPLVHFEAAMSPGKTAAYIYDAVLDGAFERFAWKDTSERFVRVPARGPVQPVAVRNRTIMAESAAGTLAVFPPPHAFFFPRDHTKNFRFAQAGKGRFGLRQDPAGGEGHTGKYIPWIDAPAGRVQRMGMFILVAAAGAEKTLERVLRYTHGDAYKPMEGRQTFASHFHFALAESELAGKPRAPEMVQIMRDMNINIVHLAEFHGDGHPKDPGPLRLPELKAMFDVCRKYSDDRVLLIPGEEANAHLPAHWVYLFRKPVYLTLVRGENQPFEETIAPYGRVYHAGNEAEMVRVLEREQGLAWTAHPRIKASFAAPDSYKETTWFKSDIWLGGAWKSMPADLSQPRLGARVLDLLDDMNTWGRTKRAHGEVDTFDLRREDELYGHANVNYLRLARRPTIDDWSPVLDSLRRGDFFVTTGEVLIHSFESKPGSVRAELEWTLPLDHVELVWWDGQALGRKSVPLPETTEHGRQAFEWPVPPGVKWVRLEAWDVAVNGAFTQVN